MTQIGVYIEMQNGVVKTTNAELLTLIRQAGCEAVGMVFAANVAPVSEFLADYGLSRLIHIEDTEYHPERYAGQLAQIIQAEKFSAVVAIESARGKDLLPRVAALIDAPLVTDCTAIDLAGGVATKPIYSSKVDAQILLTGSTRMYTLRANAVPAEKAAAPSSPEVTTMPAATVTLRSEIRELVAGVAKQVDLTEAQVIVAGGRALDSADNFSILNELASVLGAAVGASRAAVDAGYASHDMQVGQTGKVVNPRLYIACGISGAVQHFAGMKSSQVIVAINKDPDAPIFKKAHYGIVGDLFEVVPLLTAEFTKALGK